jgi:flagellar protein FliL
MRLIRDNSGKAPMAIIIAAVLVLCLGIGGFAIFKLKKSGGGKGKPAKVELKQWKLDEFLVNLVDRDENRYLKVNLVLEIKGDPPAAEGGEGGSGGNPEEIKARDAIITVLTKKSYRSLISEDGKTALKEELKQALNTSLDGLKVENIYFTSFAMQ